jgi:autotransporter-associated beta strand protein
LADSGAVTVNGGNFNLGGFSDTVGAVTLTGGAISNGTLTGTAYNLQSGAVSAVLAGNAALTKTGTGVATLTASNTYTGATAINAGELKVNGSIASSAVTVNSGASLSGSGVVGAISGAGAINPGNSPGILTAPSVDPSGGLSFNFEFTSLNPTFSSATASLNDVLRLTDATTPFIASLASLNTVNIYFNVATFEEGQFFTGAFFTDAQSDFLNEIVGATFNYYVADAAGTIEYNGVNYAALGEGLALEVSTVNANGADFAGGSVNGQITQFEVVPEPSTYALLILAAAGFGAHVWRKRRRA